jgi:hypothetical protein
MRNIEAIVNRTVEMIAQGREDVRKEAVTTTEMLKWNCDAITRIENKTEAVFELWGKIYQERCLNWGAQLTANWGQQLNAM